MYDIAAATQAVFEHCLNNLSSWTKRETGCSVLALAGGGALNSQAVNKIKERDWNSVWVPKNPGDPGSCIGAVLARTCETVQQHIDTIWYKKV
jgi:predicted NodU family carbamoyl transferase